MLFRGGWLLLLLGLILSLAACSRGGSSGSSTASDSASPPASDPNLGDAVSEEGLFSFQAPKGWGVTIDSVHDYPFCNGTAGSGGSSIEANPQGYQSVDDFVKSLAGGGDVTVVSRDSFTTQAGVNGARVVWHKGGKDVVIYAFPAKNGLLLSFTGTSSADDDGVARPLFDASMRSLSLDKD